MISDDFTVSAAGLVSCIVSIQRTVNPCLLYSDLISAVTGPVTDVSMTSVTPVVRISA